MAGPDRVCAAATEQCLRPQGPELVEPGIEEHATSVDEQVKKVVSGMGGFAMRGKRGCEGGGREEGDRQGQRARSRHLRSDTRGRHRVSRLGGPWLTLKW